MKRNISILVSTLLCIIFCLPTTTYAKNYNPVGTDISISVDDTSWYVFTRDNIKNNSELEELGITYEQMYDILHNNSAYMDAILFYENGEYTELFIRKKVQDTGIVNLSNHEDSKVLELAKGLAKRQSAKAYSVYENKYKFARLEYMDSGYYLCEFYTVVNKDLYTFTIQSTSQFTDEQYDEIENIVDSIEFDIDTSIKTTKSPSIAENFIGKFLSGAIVGGVFSAVSAIIAIINKKRKKKNSEIDTVSDSDNTESD